MPKLVKPNHKALVDLHIHDWQGCKKCKFGVNGGRKVFFRGMVPADVLFIGEAPGESEHTTGEPFTGPAGGLMTDIISMVKSQWEFTWCICNTILCTPFETKFQESDVFKDDRLCTPTQAELGPCSFRLFEFMQIVNPKLIIRVGAVSRTILPDKVNLGLDHEKVVWTPTADIIHPAYILWKKKDKQLEMTKIVSKIKAAFMEHLPPF